MKRRGGCWIWGAQLPTAPGVVGVWGRAVRFLAPGRHISSASCAPSSSLVYADPLTQCARRPSMSNFLDLDIVTEHAGLLGGLHVDTCRCGSSCSWPRRSSALRETARVSQHTLHAGATRRLSELGACFAFWYRSTASRVYWTTSKLGRRTPKLVLLGGSLL